MTQRYTSQLSHLGYDSGNNDGWIPVIWVEGDVVPHATDFPYAIIILSLERKRFGAHSAHTRNGRVMNITGRLRSTFSDNVRAIKSNQVDDGLELPKRPVKLMSIVHTMEMSPKTYSRKMMHLCTHLR